MALVLAIETSCDETAAAVVEDTADAARPWAIRSSVVASQVEIHRAWGGVVPELASRQHVRDICGVVERALAEAAVTWRDVDAMAVTQGPGLVGSLLVGVSFAKAAAWANQTPLVAVHHLAGHIESLWLDHGRPAEPIGPRPGTPIIGGHTEPHARDVMGGKAPRALLWSARLGRLFVTSIGPNIGPNPQRMEVSMNGGVGVVDLAAQRFERHLGFGAGVTEGMALDDAGGRLYVADTGLGLVRALDARALASGDGPARKSELWRLPVLPPPGFPLARDAADYGVNGRAGVELHSGPRALALSSSASELYVLDRFTATVAVVEEVRSERPRVARQIALGHIVNAAAAAGDDADVADALQEWTDLATTREGD